MDLKPGNFGIVEALKDIGTHTALGLARLVGIILASGIVDTGVGAVACLWYGAPLGLALAGGGVGTVIALVVLHAVLDAY